MALLAVDAWSENVRVHGVAIPGQVGPIPPSVAQAHNTDPVVIWTVLMEIELLRARAKMAQDQLFRLRDTKGCVAL